MARARPLHWRLLSSLCKTRPCEDTHQPACSRTDASVLLLAQTQLPGHIPTSTQASKPGSLTSHRTADSPFHRSPSSSHSSSTGELGSCHLWGSSVFGRLLLSGPLLRVFDHKLLIYLHQHLLQSGPARSPQPLPAAQPERALWRRAVTFPLKEEPRRKGSRTARKQRKVSWPRS